jgi:GNAT superfamily N-acetyltransferase
VDIKWANIPGKEMVASQLGGTNDLSLHAEFEDRLVGFILARLIYAGVPITGTCLVLFIAVHPDFQGRGIGSMLISALKTSCKDKGIDIIRVLVPQYESRLMRYFEKMGFSPSFTINLDSSVYPDYQL